MDKTDTEYVDIGGLRLGMYIELELGWMAHPFPTGSFKITSERQLETIRTLGLAQVRWNPSKSDFTLVDDTPPPPHIETPEEAQEAAQREQAVRQREHAARRVHQELVSDQQRNLAACERKFNLAAQQYRATIEQLHQNPKQAGQQCNSMVNGFVSTMTAGPDVAIRLLSESAGDKAALHPINVTVVSLLLGKALGLPAAELADLGVAAFTHDLGKIDLPERVRNLEDNFSSAEMRAFQAHVAESVKVAKSIGLSASAIKAIEQHHEMADGSGFPAQLKGDAMTMGARILSLVNRYDALCNPAKVKSAITPHEALAMIFAQLKTRFDSAVLSAFIRMMGVYPPGSVVQLIDDRYALVVSVNSSRPLKPRVMVHEPSIPRDQALILDLELAPLMSIRRSLKPSALPPDAMDYLSPRRRVNYFFEVAPEPKPVAEA